MGKYLIPEINVSSLERKLKSIANKCAKYGNEFSYSWGDQVFKTLHDDVGRLVYVCYIELETHGVVEAESGWTFVAAIDHTPKGNIVRQWDLSLVVPEKYYTADPVCEHCHSNRHRVQTCLLYNKEQDEWKQVGTSCMKDFTGSISAEYAAALASFIADVEDHEHFNSFGQLPKYFPVHGILLYAQECINKFGYQNSESVRPTGERVFEYYHAVEVIDYTPSEQIADELKRFNINAYTPENEAAVDGAVEWILSTEDDDSYLHNLKVLVACGYIKSREVNLLSSLMITYKRHLDKLARESEKAARRDAEKVSEYQGTIGERITVSVKSADLVTSWDGYYGWTGLYKFVDADGNVYIWYSSSSADLNRVTTITGTVKEHSEYEGVKQTVLSRCKLAHEHVA